MGVADLTIRRVELGVSRRSRTNDMGGAKAGIGSPVCVDKPASSAEGGRSSRQASLWNLRILARPAKSVSLK
jgi:hypothetical protein